MLKLSRFLTTSVLLLVSQISLGANFLSNGEFKYGGTGSLYFNSTTSGVDWFKSRTNPFYYSQATLNSSYTLNNIALRGEAMIIEGTPRLNYALTDIGGGDLDILYGIRAGKYVRRTGLYDDVRFNSARRRFIYLPTTLYYPAAEEWLSGAVGGQVYLKKSLFSGKGNILFEVDYGIPWQSNTTTRHQFSQIYGGQEIDNPDNFEHYASTFISFRLMYRNWKATVTYNPNTKWGYVPTSQQAIPANEATQQTVWTGIEYRGNKLLMSAEGYTGTITTNYTTLPVNDSELRYYTYALTAGYDITDRIQISAFTSQIFLHSESDVFVTGNIVRTSTALKQRDSAITARYSLTKNWHLRAEAHYFNGNPITLLGFGDDNSFPINENKDYGLFTVGVDFIF